MLELKFIFLHFHGPTNSCCDNWFYFFLRTGNVCHISSEIPNLATEDTVSVLPISIQVRTDCWGQLVKRSIEWINNAMTMLWRAHAVAALSLACKRCRESNLRIVQSQLQRSSGEGRWQILPRRLFRLQRSVFDNRFQRHRVPVQLLLMPYEINDLIWLIITSIGALHVHDTAWHCLVSCR